MRDMVAEVYAKVPEGEQSPDDDGHMIIELAREAAHEAFGEKEKKKTEPEEEEDEE